MVYLSLRFVIFVLVRVCGMCNFDMVSASNNTPTSGLGKVVKNDGDIQQLLETMLKKYDQKVRPNYLGNAVDVAVDATVMTISKIDEVNMMYTLGNCSSFCLGA